jgi:hypothetical protein
VPVGSLALRKRPQVSWPGTKLVACYVTVRGSIWGGSRGAASQLLMPRFETPLGSRTTLVVSRMCGKAPLRKRHVKRFRRSSMVHC